MITPADLLAPLGSLEAESFISLDSSELNARLQQYLADGASRSTTDDGKLYWAYYRAYTSLAEMWASQPASGTLTGLGAVAIGTSQYKYFASKADEYLAKFQALSAETVSSSRPTTKSVPSTYVW